MADDGNQLAYIRQNINDIPRNEWPRLAEDAGVLYRSLYHFEEEDFNPRYNTVFGLYKAIKRAKRRMKK
jgi:DNA-binding phage protein